MRCECGMKALAEVEWSVPELGAGDGAERLRMALEDIPAVRGVRVRVSEKTVLVGFDDAQVSVQLLKEAINKAGFPSALTREEIYRLEIFGSGELSGLESRI